MISMFDLLLSLSLVLCLLSPGVVAAPSGSIWVVNVHNEPAPLPQDGPPESADAVRDPAALPIEVSAIVGSYFVWILLTAIAIITVGRRLRQGAQTSPRSLQMEILNPTTNQAQSDNLPKAWGPSPVSPVKANPWDPSPVSPTKKNNPWSPKLGSWVAFKKHNRQDSMQSSVVTFDESVISDDRQKNEIEMDRLYAAVAEHEAQTVQGRSYSKESSPTSPTAQNPPELQHLRYAPQHHEHPLSPPPDPEYPRSPTSPMAPSRESTGTPRRLNKKAPPPLSFNNPPSRNSSRSSFASFRSFGKKRGTSVRELPISPPMGSPDMAPDSYGEAEPLTPRYYAPGPPPTPPATRNEPLASPQPGDYDRRFHFSPSIRSSRSSATGGFSPAQTPRTATFPIAPPPVIAEEQNRAGIAISIDHAADAKSSLPPPPAPKDKGFRSKPAPLNISNSTNTSQSTLPLRTAPLPLRSLRSPNSTRPISTIRTQEINRPDPGRLRAPGTALPTTPYSPFYMPQTPLTPMTPSRLVTREERKRAKKEEGRRVLTEEDKVPEEAELWGDGY